MRPRVQAYEDQDGAFNKKHSLQVWKPLVGTWSPLPEEWQKAAENT